MQKQLPPALHTRASGKDNLQYFNCNLARSLSVAFLLRTTAKLAGLLQPALKSHFHFHLWETTHIHDIFEGGKETLKFILIQTTPSCGCPRKLLLLLTLPSADKLMRQQFRTCPIWDRALGPLQMNSFPCEWKKLQPLTSPLGFHLSQPTGPRQVPSP